MSIHVLSPSGVSFYCGAASGIVITPEELRRRIHAHSRAATEPTICPVCFAKARLRVPKGPRLKGNPRKRKPPRPKDSGLGKLGSSPWRK